MQLHPTRCSPFTTGGECNQSAFTIGAPGTPPLSGWRGTGLIRPFLPGHTAVPPPKGVTGLKDHLLGRRGHPDANPMPPTPKARQVASSSTAATSARTHLKVVPGAQQRPFHPLQLLLTDVSGKPADLQAVKLPAPTRHFWCLDHYAISGGCGHH